MDRVIKKPPLLKKRVEVGVVIPDKNEELINSPFDQPFGELDFSGNVKKLLTPVQGRFKDRIAALIRKLKLFEEHYRSTVETTSSESYERGRVEGVTNEGLQILETLRSYVNEVTSQRDHFLQNSEADVIELAVRIAGKIVDSKVEVDQGVAARVVRRCLEHIGNNETIVVRVSPEDYEEVSKHQSEWMDRIKKIENCKIKADPGISCGGCLVETTSGFINGQIEAQLETFSRKLNERTDTL